MTPTVGAPSAADLPAVYQTDDYRALYEASPCAYLTMGSDFTIIGSNGTAQQWFGPPARTPSQAPNLQDILTAAAWTVFAMKCVPVLQMAGEIREVALDVKRQDGLVVPVLGAFQRVGGASSQPFFIRATLFDATERRLYEREMLKVREQAEESRARLATILEATTDGVLLVEADWRISYANPQGLRLLPGARAGTDLREVAPWDACGVFREALERAFTGPGAAAEVAGPAGDAWLLIRAYPASSGGLAVFVRDMTLERQMEEERRRSAERIAYLATHDALTGLPNRILLKQRLSEASGMSETVALLCLDLDRFKQVNDRLGHAAGDALLQAVADRLRHDLRPDDLVARIGGDEFVILLRPGPAARGRTDQALAGMIAARLIRALSAPYMLEGERVEIGASVGLTVADAHRLDPETLFEEADVALYHAKRAGRGQYMAFQPGMLAEQQQRARLADALRQALRLGEMVLHYQPVVELSSRRLWGYEALLRWNRPGVGPVSPASFIAIAEDTGLIGELGGWVITEACRNASEWPGGHLGVAVNLSPLQLRHADLVERVVDALGQSGLNANRLELEVTESVLLEGRETVLETMRDLRARGISFAMDDFGTGFSSLASLRSFPFSKVKVERRFVQAAGVNDEDEAVVAAVAALAKRLGMACTAEGIESEAQLALVTRIGCSHGQGFLLGRPTPQEELLTASLT